MLKNKFYHQAMKCFTRAEDETLFKRAEAFHKADEASNNLLLVDSTLGQMKLKEGDFENMNKKNKKIEKKRLKTLEKESFLILTQCAEVFLAIDLKKQAAQCFFTAQNFERAKVLYLELGYFKQAGECCFVIENFIEAALLFEKTNDYIRVLECYDVVNNFEKIIETLYKYKDLIPNKDKDAYFHKYMPLALESLVYKLNLNFEDGIKNLCEEEVEKKKKEQEIIEEDEDESDESDEDGEENSQRGEEEKLDYSPNKIKKNIEKILEKEEEENLEIDYKEKNKNNNTTDLIDDLSLDISIKKDKSEFIIKNDKEEEKISDKYSVDLKSFNNETSIISHVSPNKTDSKFEEINKEEINYRLEGLEHLSHLDLDDEWLHIEKGSIIDSLSSFRKNPESKHLDYSAIEYSEILKENTAIVKTKTDIYVQDDTMQKIIKYICLFSDEFESHLKSLKSKSTLLSRQEDKLKKDYDEIVDFIVDLDQIDLETVHFILDILESYKIYKLCIFVCNRYQLAQRIGRYIVSIAHKYSTIPTNDYVFGYYKKQLTPLYRASEMEKAFVANFALHQVFENINPEYLKIKKIPSHFNSLGVECYRGLILLGYWKKVVFLMDFNNSLAVASTFADFENYVLIFFSNQKKAHKYSGKDLFGKSSYFENIPYDIPVNRMELNFSLICLEHFIWDHADIRKKALDLKNFNEIFPNYFAYNEALWNFLFDSDIENEETLIKFIEEGCLNLLKIFGKDKDFESELIELRIFDLVSFFIQILEYSKFINKLNLLIFSLPLSVLLNFFNVSKKISRFLNNIFSMNEHYNTILRGIFSVYKARLPEDSEVLKTIGCNNYVITSFESPILSEGKINFIFLKKIQILKYKRRRRITKKYILC